MFDKRTLSIYSIILGTFFVISGIGKVVDTAGFSTLIYKYGLGYLMVLSPVIVVAEIILGVCLILVINPKRHSLYSLVFLVIFTCSFAYAYFAKGVSDCGCFGTLQHSTTSPVFSFARNLILIGMAALVWLNYPSNKTRKVRWKVNVVLVTLVLSTFVAGFTFRTPFIFTAPSAEHKFQNKDIRDTDLSKYISTSKDSTYLIFCFSYTCPHCWNSIENLRQYKELHKVDRIVALVTGSKADKLIFEQNFHPDFNVKDLPENELLNLATHVPTSFFVKNDTIKVIIQSVLPSPITFQREYKMLK
ncbi:MAG: hypothetical protein M0R39_08830 [Prolixibacteraceae bacterium]|nr:hypothetical protein [Prolixibacteraceae bacterium]